MLEDLESCPGRCKVSSWARKRWTKVMQLKLHTVTIDVLLLVSVLDC